MMRYIFIFLICFISVQSFAQPIIKRNDGTTTALDSSLFTGKAFRVPVFQDTTSANTYRVLDSSGRLIFTRDSSNLWVRTVSNGWQKVGFNNGGGSLDSSVYYTIFRADTSRNNIYNAISSIQSDSIFFASPIKVNGDTAYLNPVSVVDSGYLTPVQWNYIRLKVDSVKIYNDSLYYFVGDGDSTFVGLVGGGGSVTLQQAFDNSPVPQINAGNSQLYIVADDGTYNTGFSVIGNGIYSAQNWNGASGAGSLWQISPSEMQFNFTGHTSNLFSIYADTIGMGLGYGAVIPTTVLDVQGNPRFRTDSAQAGYVWTAKDVNGNGEWRSVSGGGGGITTSQLTDSLNNRALSYKFRNDSTGNSGYTTLYQYNKGKDSLLTLINANTASINTKKNNSDSIGNGGYTTLFQYNKGKDSLQTNIDLKANIASPTFTGTVTSPAVTLTSTSTGFLPNRVTTAQMNAISSPVDGMQVYNTYEGLVFNYSTAWGWESSALSWRRKNGVEYFNDFLGIVTTATQSTTDGNLITFASGGVASSSTSPATNRQGILTLSTSTSATGRAGLATSSGTTNQTMILGGGKILFETTVNFATLSSPTERYQFLCGFSTTNNSTTITNGVLFAYDSAGVSTGSAASPNWQVMTASGSSRSWTTTSVAVSAATWYTLRVEINAAATQVDFYINNTLVKSETTNIPTVATGLMHQIYKTVGTTARTADIDYVYFKQKYTTPR